MPKLLRILIFSAVFTLNAAAAGTSHAGENLSSPVGTAWDNAVNNLLATGMYGFDGQGLPGLKVQLQHSENLYRALGADKARRDGQAITFSYDGSSGLLEFSAGYILSTQQTTQESGTIFLGLDSESDPTFNPGHSWYMAFDLSQSYQIDDTLSFTLGNKAMLLQNPFNTEEGQIFSLLFNMPISYKNYLTITPELQWFHPVSQSNSINSDATSGAPRKKSSEDVFYGGISISFSY